MARFCRTAKSYSIRDTAWYSLILLFPLSSSSCESDLDSCMWIEVEVDMRAKVPVSAVFHADQGSFPDNIVTEHRTLYGHPFPPPRTSRAVGAGVEV